MNRFKPVQFPAYLLMVLLSASYSGSTLAQAAGQIATALQHTQFAAQSEALDGVHRHIQHLINCLEGPQGSNFNAGAGNPCQGQGQGALNDLGDMAPARSLVEQAHALALIALAIETHAPAQKVASAAADLLQQAQTAM